MAHLIPLTKVLGSFLAVATLGTSVPASAEGDKEHARERFEKLDADGDGSISRAEYLAGRKGLQKATAATRFARIDTDDDGALSKKEWKAAAKARSKAE